MIIIQTKSSWIFHLQPISRNSKNKNSLSYICCVTKVLRKLITWSCWFIVYFQTIWLNFAWCWLNLIKCNLPLSSCPKQQSFQKYRKELLSSLAANWYYATTLRVVIRASILVRLGLKVDKICGLIWAWYLPYVWGAVKQNQNNFVTLNEDFILASCIKIPYYYCSKRFINSTFIAFNSQGRL